MNEQHWRSNETQWTSKATQCKRNEQQWRAMKETHGKNQQLKRQEHRNDKLYKRWMAIDEIQMKKQRETMKHNNKQLTRMKTWKQWRERKAMKKTWKHESNDKQWTQMKNNAKQ